MYSVYILYSKRKDKYYVGQTNNVEKRLERHNRGEVRSTKYGIPWELRYINEYESRSESMNEEKRIKRQKSRSYIEDLIREMD